MSQRLIKIIITEMMIVVALICLAASYKQCHADYVDSVEQYSPMSDPNTANGLLTLEQLVAVTTQCRQQVLQAHQLKSQVPTQNLREYAITLGIASEKCEAMIRGLTVYQQMANDYAEYTRNLQHARLSAHVNESGNLNETQYDTPSDIYDTGLSQAHYTHSNQQFNAPDTAIQHSEIINEDFSIDHEPIQLH